jgi:hypothetical protein
MRAEHAYDSLKHQGGKRCTLRLADRRVRNLLQQTEYLPKERNCQLLLQHPTIVSYLFQKCRIHWVAILEQIDQSSQNQ